MTDFRKKKEKSVDSQVSINVRQILFVLAVEMLIQSIQPKTSLKLLLKTYRSRYYSKINFKEWNIIHKWVLETLRWKITIDYLIEEFLGKNNLKKNLKITALELATYLLLFEKLSVTNIVAMVESFFNTQGLSFKKKYKEYLFHVNRIDLNKYKPQGGKITQLAFRYSIPKWLVKKIVSQLSSETVNALFESYSKPPENRFIFINPIIQPTEKTLMELYDQGIELEQDIVLKNTFYVTRNASKLVLTNAYLKGAVIFQEWGSIAIGQALPIKKGGVVLDACAAPGNKTLQLLARKKSSLIVAGEFNPSRAKLLRDRLTVFGSSIPVIIYDAKHPSFSNYFDSILIDAPCTGTGTLSSHPELKWKLKPEIVKANSKLQLSILNSTSRFIKKGGYLLYSTCSVLREENEDNILAFLKNNPSWELVDEIHSQIGVPSPFLKNSRRIYPNKIKNEAYYLALLKKKK